MDNPQFPFAHSCAGSLLPYLLLNALDINTAQFFLAAPAWLGFLPALGLWQDTCRAQPSHHPAAFPPGHIALLGLDFGFSIWEMALFAGVLWGFGKGFVNPFFGRVGGIITAKGVQGSCGTLC